MISPGGVAPYKVAAQPGPEGEAEDGTLYWIEDLDEELEVLGEDTGGDNA